MSAADGYLYVKHRVATSRAARPASRTLRLIDGLRARRHPELALLRQEDRMIDAVLARLVSWGSRCLDVGGHIGSVAQRLCALAGPESVQIVEASPSKARWLARRFGADRVHAVGVAEEDGALTFYEDPDRPGYSSLKRPAGAARLRETVVPIRRLDTLFPAPEAFDFVKLDVEGSELSALRGATGLLARGRPTILFEAGPARQNPEGAALFEHLTEGLGYEVRAVFEVGHGTAPLTPALFERYRTYPFLAFNYVAQVPEGTHAA